MTDATASAPSKDAIKQELEATKVGYHQLLDSLSADDFKKKSGTWSNGQLMWHLAWGTEFVSDGVERCRKGKNLPLPRGVANALNPWVTRWGSRGATPESVSKKFDAALDKAIATLATVKDDEWTRGAKIYGVDQTVELVLHLPASHFAEHKADILKNLGRALS
jgi:DinB superfamily